MSRSSHDPEIRSWPAWIVAAYLAFGGLWIFASHWTAGAAAPDRIRRLQTVEGLVFVLASAALLVALIAVHRRRVRRAARSRRAAEGRLQSLLAHVPEAIVVLDEAREVTYASPGLETLFGLPRDDLRERSLLRRIHPDDAPRLEASLGPDLPPRGEVDDSLEFRARGRDGRWKICQGTVANLLDDGDVAGIVLNFRDVTAREIARTRTQQSDKLEAIDNLASGIAHDFHDLLAAIRGHNELALETLPSGDPRRDDLEEVREASERAAVLIRRLLAFSRRRDVDPVELEPNEAIEAALPRVERLLPPSIELDVHLDPGAERIRLDPGHLEEILLNLVTNARDAMPDGGALRIETRGEIVPYPRISGDFSVDAGRYTCLEVTDTGEGMGPETLGRVFEPFFTTRPDGEGTGLGLATVFGIVKEYGGYVLVDSEPGRGSRFRIYLPVDARAARRPGSDVTGSGRAWATR